MSNPAAQLRRLVLTFQILVTMKTLVGLRAPDHLLTAVVVGAVALVGLFAGARPAVEGRACR